MKKYIYKSAHTFTVTYTKDFKKRKHIHTYIYSNTDLYNILVIQNISLTQAEVLFTFYSHSLSTFKYFYNILKHIV